MSALRVRLFGKLCVERGDQALAGLDSRRVQELFVYLLLFRDHPHPRERLADVMWGEGTSAQVRKNLRQALWKLQSVVGEGVNGQAAPGRRCVLGGQGRVATSTAPSLLCVDSEYVQLNAAADLWVDAAVFERAHAQAQGVAGAALDDQAACALRQAAALYQGDLLDGWYQDWCLFERERYQHMYLEMLAKLMAHAEAHAEYDAGVDFGTRILRYDRARERTHRALMRLYYLAGDRVEALRQYERCAAALAEEIGVAPARRTVELAERVRGDVWEGANGSATPISHWIGPDRSGRPGGVGAIPDQLDAAAPSAANAATAAALPAAGTQAALLGAVLDDLCSLRTALGEIERLVDHKILAVQQALGMEAVRSG